MSRFAPRAPLAALLLAAASGCVKQSIPTLPSVLQPGEGILVARLYVLGMQAMEDASVDIDGRLHGSAMTDGYVAMALPAGDHKLNRVRAAGQLLSRGPEEREAPTRLAKGGYVPTYIYVPGSRQTVHYTTLSVDREFRIEPGRVTNLGLLVYLPATDNEKSKRASVPTSRQFRVIAVDNAAEARSFLDTNYPALMATVGGGEVLRAPARYLEPTKYSDLRRAIAYHEQRGANVLYGQDRLVIYGRAGTIVSLSPGKTEKDEPRVEVLDTGTLADVLGGVRRGERYTFVTSDGVLLTWENGTLKKDALPQRLHPVGIYGLGKSDLLVIDNRLRMLTAREAAGPWTEHLGLLSRTPRRDVEVASDEEGAYVSVGNKDVPGNVHYLKAGEPAPKPLVSPSVDSSLFEGRYVMIARRSGLFVFYGSQNFLHRAKGDGNWSWRRKPGADCRAMRLDEEGQEAQVECGGVQWRSTDAGATWKRPEA